MPDARLGASSNPRSGGTGSPLDRNSEGSGCNLLSKPGTNARTKQNQTGTRSPPFSYQHRDGPPPKTQGWETFVYGIAFLRLGKGGRKCNAQLGAKRGAAFLHGKRNAFSCFFPFQPFFFSVRAEVLQLYTDNLIHKQILRQQRERWR
jgi:hypothetical protein